MWRTKLPQVPIAFIQVEDMTNVALAELSVITILASLSVLFFEITPVQASLSDLDNIKPTDPIEPETGSPSQDEEDSDRGGHEY